LWLVWQGSVNICKEVSGLNVARWSVLPAAVSVSLPAWVGGRVSMLLKCFRLEVRLGLCLPPAGLSCVD
jgi:hypothetical protein